MGLNLGRKGAVAMGCSFCRLWVVGILVVIGVAVVEELMGVESVLAGVCEFGADGIDGLPKQDAGGLRSLWSSIGS